MTLDERLARAAHHVADDLDPPEVNLDALRHRARAYRRRGVALAVAVGVVVVAALGAAVVSVREISAPVSPAGPHRPPTSGGLESPAWLGDMPTGTGPLTPYWHAGVLHVMGAEIATPFSVGEVEVAGETIIVTSQPLGDGSKSALVRNGRLERLPASAVAPRLSVDGRIAYWQVDAVPSATRFIAWDTKSNSELASRTVAGRFEGDNRLQMVGIDADGIAYWVDQSSENPVMRWDVRSDTVESTDVPFDFAEDFEHQAAPLPDAWVGLTDAFVSPDSTKELFIGSAPGDATPDCCTDRLRVRPVSRSESMKPSDIVELKLPEGVPAMRLWTARSDRGFWGVWWETNETVLLDAYREGRSYLLRCSATSGACESIFELGPNTRSKGNLYYPDWESDWSFARFPFGS